MLFRKGIMCTRSISTLLLNQIWILVLFCQIDSEIYLHSIYLTDFPTIWHQGYWLYVSYGKSSCTLWNYSSPICMYMFYDIIYEMEGKKTLNMKIFFRIEEPSNIWILLNSKRLVATNLSYESERIRLLCYSPSYLNF